MGIWDQNHRRKEGGEGETLDILPVNVAYLNSKAMMTVFHFFFENETSLRFPFRRLEIAFRVNDAKFWFFDYLAYFPEHKNVTIGPLGQIIDTIQSPHTLCSLKSLAQEITVYMYDFFADHRL